MALTPDDIRRLQHLARLELQPAESDRMLAQINEFFSIVEAMRAVDTSGIEPLAHPVAAIQERSAPAVERGLFLVPKVIE
jgi:aspartyl-tRNA(Asn)/glutamyl-tRNA(Gln) amidotransferase subunit C